MEVMKLQCFSLREEDFEKPFGEADAMNLHNLITS